MSARLRPLVEPVLGAEAERFIEAGLAAIEAGRQRPWIQLNLKPAQGCEAELTSRLEQLARELLAGPAVNFFHLHKPPGLRIRFEVGGSARATVEAEVRAALEPLADQLTTAVYEPEAALFGGVRSMPYVHRLFTVDSLAWLGHAVRRSGTPGWAYSLALLRPLLAGLGVVGWEDLDVWDRIAHQAGRRWPASVSDDRITAAGQGIRALWLDEQRHAAELDTAARDLIADWGPRIATVAAQWRSGYFEAPGAVIGPREAAAFAIVFHWNRGRLDPAVQALLTGALGDRTARP